MREFPCKRSRQTPAQTPLAKLPKRGAAGAQGFFLLRNAHGHRCARSHVDPCRCRVADDGDVERACIEQRFVPHVKLLIGLRELKQPWQGKGGEGGHGRGRSSSSGVHVRRLHGERLRLERILVAREAGASEADPVGAQERLASRPRGHLSAARSAEDEGDQGTTDHGARYHATDASTASAQPRRARLLTLLSSDARVTMPPQPLELIGHEAIGVFLDNRAEVRGAPLQLRPTRANGQPAFGYYLRSQPRGMMVLTLSGSKVDEITFFADPALPGRFGLPEHI